MTLAEFQDAMQKAIGDQKNLRQRIDRIRVLDPRYNNIMLVEDYQYDIEAVNFDENSGTLYIEIKKS